MNAKWPDTQVCQEIRDFNREFLDLARADLRPGLALGLAHPLRERLAGLQPTQLDAIAETPCLLAGFAVLPPRWPPGVVADGGPPARTDALRLYAAGLLTWLWHTSREDPLLAALCIGPGPGAARQLAGAGVRDLQRAAASAGDSLEARFCRHPRLWPDLVRAASRADPEVLVATRLSVVQLTLVSRG